MGDPRGRYGPSPDRFRLFAAALAAAALALAHPAGSQTRSPRNAPAPVATGSVVGYQESAGSAILYHEEKGGMVTQVPPPVPKAAGQARPANAPATKAAANGGPKAPAKGGTRAPAPVAPKLAQQ